MRQPSHMEVAIGLVLWGLCFLGFPLFAEQTVGMPAVAAWACLILGFLIFLIGMMGVCIELGKKYPGGRNDG